MTHCGKRESTVPSMVIQVIAVFPFNKDSIFEKKEQDLGNMLSLGKSHSSPHLQTFLGDDHNDVFNDNADEEIYDFPDSDYGGLEEEETESSKGNMTEIIQGNMNVAMEEDVEVPEAAPLDFKTKYYKCRECYFLSSQKDGL